VRAVAEERISEVGQETLPEAAREARWRRLRPVGVENSNTKLIVFGDTEQDKRAEVRRAGLKVIGVSTSLLIGTDCQHGGAQTQRQLISEE